MSRLLHTPTSVCPDYEIVRAGIIKVSVFTGTDAVVLIVPLGHQAAYGSLGDLGKVAHDEPSVFSGELHLAGE
jgi:hypothetical protein